MKRILLPGISTLMLMLAVLMIPPAAKAQYNANVGAETRDEAVQADGFFPNELWIKVGDSITWTFVPKNEVHTVSFLTQIPAEQPRPPFGPPPCLPPKGAPAATFTSGLLVGTQKSGSSYDGTTCVTSAPLANGATFTVTFPTAGLFKLVCLVHTDMNGTVHVVSDTSLLHSQRFYDDRARDQAQALLSDDNHRNDDDRGWKDRSGDDKDNAVTAGIGEIVATGGGLQYRAVVRFLDGTIRIHAGESVEWTNLDPTEPHTVTFGTEPANFIPTTQVNLGALTTDGILTGTVNSAGEFLSSGFIVAQAPDRVGSPQLRPGTTRIRITFPTAGTYQYHCALHDTDGMVGTVIVLP